MMMTKLTMILMLAVLISPAVAENLGTLSTADYVRVWCKAINSSGIEASPDSGHVLVSFNREATANSASYSAAWITSGATGSEIDSVLYNGHTYYYFVDLVADIDNGEGNGPYFGDVVLYTGGLPWHNKFAFTLAADEFTDYLATLTSILADVTNLDAWNPATDSTHVNGLNAARLAALDYLDHAISTLDNLILDEDTTGHKLAGSFGLLFTYLDSLNNLLTIADIASEVADSAATREFTLSLVGLDADSSFTNLQATAAKIYAWCSDSLPTVMGFPGSTVLPWSYQIPSANADTTVIGIGTDTLWGIEYIHDGGASGDNPDSTHTFIWP